MPSKKSLVRNLPHGNFSCASSNVTFGSNGRNNRFSFKKIKTFSINSDLDSTSFCSFSHKTHHSILVDALSPGNSRTPGSISKSTGISTLNFNDIQGDDAITSQFKDTCNSLTDSLAFLVDASLDSQSHTNINAQCRSHFREIRREVIGLVHRFENFVQDMHPIILSHKNGGEVHQEIGVAVVHLLALLKHLDAAVAEMEAVGAKGVVDHLKKQWERASYTMDTLGEGGAMSHLLHFSKKKKILSYVYANESVQQLRRWNARASHLLVNATSSDNCLQDLEDFSREGVDKDFPTSCVRSQSIAKAILGEEYADIDDLLKNCNLIDNSESQNQAILISEAALKRETQILGKTHPDVATTHYLLGLVYKKIGKIDKAMECFEEALVLNREAYGNNHAMVGDILQSIAMTYEGGKKYKRALTMYEDSLKVYKEYGYKSESSVIIFTLQNIKAVEEKIKSKNFFSFIQRRR
uniref:Uncharacterized protein n=1 Tax=Corethron hystrix TaxID=216773 RepID=A0A6U5IJM1_9STRA|mmetsp:Transcript_34020/g.78499  ORF Transcript_34020/g.78499 Transcript_34020/m.78499 type:complete len:467 (+) Transcript_34020:395-1795(+)|eukprot:CAMPEP_0113302670 /NCGR_PEP_ID=MMETSP0010_2-20120614/3399_1 /TAXON_ID=216773 ORGANISM="Corethron hystrix, Strain 308" /NCGR_SAMPLE_ID=MMETSP0010_2 /ASSEMBLY_ACC=CAM_ASM_000155 /LENGTH=466 /DNA_ID=CAMNT_0000156525 /DNA_START=384 /DNA_END=1784 /DNA_ORIENTATION=+ /assembly_acc=CAM_ASM_000155